MKKLSVSAQAVLDALHTNNSTGPERFDARANAAAALQAVADQVVPEEPLHGGDQRWMYERDARQDTRRQLLAIAAELRADRWCS